MSFELTSRVLQSLNKVQKTPAIVVLFDGIDTPFSSMPIFSYYLLDDGYSLDEGLYLDTLNQLSNQITAISFGTGSSATTTKIDYRIDPDLGIGDSVTSMKISFVDDKKQTFVNLLNDYELLGRKVRIKFVPDSTTAIYPRDYITIFRGIVDEVSYESGSILVSISHPDQKKRQTIFISHTTTLTAAIDNNDTTIPVEDASDFLRPITGGDGLNDAAFYSFVRIDDEIIFVDDVSGNNLVDCVRAQLSTSAVAHDADAEVTSYYLLQGDAMTLALKLMLSGWNGNFVEDVPVVRIETGNKIIIAKDISDEFGLNLGDYVTTSGAINGVNNATYAPISALAYDEDTGLATITVSGESFIYEATDNIVAAFRSRFDVLPSGLRMSPDEVDVLEHSRIGVWFLASASMQFYLKETIDSGKEFINKEIYQPVAAFSIPKNTRASVGYTIPPLPDELVRTLNSTNIKNPEKIRHIRQIGRNFYNSIIYKYDEDELENASNAGLFITDADSRTQIPVGNKVFTITSKGLRSGSVANNAANRRLHRYKLAAAQIQNLKSTFGEGLAIDIGDNIYVDGVSLKIPDISQGGGNTFSNRLYQVIQKTIDIKTGDITFVMLDTNFSNDARYGFISPTSEIASVTSDSEFTIQTSFGYIYDEYTKWTSFVGASIQVRNSDLSITATGVISEVLTDNTIILEDSLSVTPSAGMFMEFSDYVDQGLPLVKTVYTHITDGSANFADGGAPYYMI